MKPWISLLGALAAWAAGVFTTRLNADIVYDNTAVLYGAVRSSTNEFGDEVILAGSPDQQWVTGFLFGYFLTTEASGNERIRVRFYDVSGEGGRPGVLLYDSGFFAIYATVNGYSSCRLTPQAVVPRDFVWTVEWEGIETGDNEKGALVFNDPPTVGQSTDAADGGSYWERLQGEWQRRWTLHSVPRGNFYAQVTATNVPQSNAPEILAPPQTQSIPEGGSLALTVSAVGTEPLAYQWQWQGADLAGATNSSLQFEAAALTQAGDYRVIVSNPFGAVTSAVAVLTVTPVSHRRVVFDNTAPASAMLGLEGEYGGQVKLAADWRTRQIVEFVCEYYLATNTATADETLRVRFYDNTGWNGAPGVLLYDSGPQGLTPGVRHLTLTPDVAVPDTFTWTAQFAGPAGVSDYALTIPGPPTVGTSVDGYWRRDPDTQAWGQEAWSDSNGGTNAAVGFSARITADWQATNRAPTIVTPPRSEVTTNGLDVVLSVAASGTQPLSYQWEFQGNALPGATSSSLVLSNVQAAQAGQYVAWVTNVAGQTSSAPAVLTVRVRPAIDTQPLAQAVIAGADFALQVAATGTPPLAYQWYFNDLPLAWATQATLPFTGADASHEGYYQVEVVNPVGSVLSDLAAVKVVSPPETRAVYANLTTDLGRMISLTNEVGEPVVLAGSPLERFVTSVRARCYLTQSAPTGELAVLRLYAATGADLTPASLLFEGAPLALTPGTNDLVWTPRVAVSDSLVWTLQFSGPAVPGQAGLPLYDPPTVGSNPGHVWVNTGSAWSRQTVDGGHPAHFAVEIVAGPSPAPPVIYEHPQSAAVWQGASASLHVGVVSALPLTYRWYAGERPLEDATNATLSWAAVQAADAGAYRVEVANALGSAASRSATLTVDPPPTIVSEPLATSASAGSEVSFQVTAQGAGQLGYQWYFDDQPLADATNATLRLPAVTGEQVGLYRVAVRNEAGETTSTAAALTLVGVTAPGRLSLTGPLGAQYLVQSRDGFETNSRWTLLEMIVVTNRPTLLVDTNATGLRQRFYRALWLP